MAIENARGGGIQAGQRVNRRFQAANIGGCQRLQGDAIGGGPFGVMGQQGQFCGVAGHQQLADGAMGDAPLSAIAVKPFPARYAQAGFQRTRRVIQAGVDDFRIARRGLRTKAFLRFQNQHFMARQRQRSGDG
jgi:hypothetical protein